MNAAMLKALLTEYGVPWLWNRSRYAARLKLMRQLPSYERRFEQPVSVQRIDLFDMDADAIASFLKALPSEEQNRLTAQADKAIHGVILGFSSVELDYGDPPDWQLSPLTGGRCDAAKKWYAVPDFDPQRGDIKAVWEISRFSHFFLLARAYLLTDDRKYYEAFSVQLANWLEQNPYPFGANYKCGQECSLRMIGALLTYAVFAARGMTVQQDEEHLKQLVTVCYQKVLANFFYAYKCIRNNHTLSEITGMMVGAWCCGDNRQLDKAYRLMDEVICEQFTPDGGYVQFSFTYQRLAMQLMECVAKLSRKTGRTLSADSRERIAASVRLMCQCQDDDGDMPNYGSNDGALIFPVTSCGYRDFRPMLNTAAALYTGRRLYPHGAWDEELLWFGGANTPREDIIRISSDFPQAGLFTLRDERGFVMLPLQNFRNRPAHMDQLHFDLWQDGINLLCDSGTYSYADELHKQLFATDGHNTVQPDGVEQMSKWGAFLVYNRTKRTAFRHGVSSFEGTMVSKNGYSHTRAVERTADGWRITDRVDGKSPCTARWHTPCEVRLHDGGATLLWRGQPVAEIVCDAPLTVQPAIRSLYYLKKDSITCLSARFERELHTEIRQKEVVKND